MGARYCGPACNFSALGGPPALVLQRPERRPLDPPTPATPVFFEAPPEVPVEAMEAVPVEEGAAETQVEEEASAGPMFALEPPPDEPPIRRRLYL